MNTAKNAASILEDREFTDLCRRKNTVSAWLTVVTVVVYFGFILLVASGSPILKAKVYGSLSAGIPIGIGVIVLSWVLTGIYVWWANSNYDSLVERLKTRMGG